MSNAEQKVDAVVASVTSDVKSVAATVQEVKTEGVKQYIWSKKVTLSVAVLLIIVAASFLAGAIIF